MDRKSVIEQTTEYARKSLKKDYTGHDWWHTYRVWELSLKISQGEKDIDLFVIQLAALLHDIADWKFYKGDISKGTNTARRWLEKLKVEEKVISHVCEIIKEISFKGAGAKSQMKTKEGMIVQDADRLDALGAIGIARAFAYGGSKNRPMYDPNVPPKMHKTFEEYKKHGETHTLNHFYEKLLLLKDLMNTRTGKKFAEERHKFIEDFLERFLKEWEGRE